MMETAQKFQQYWQRHFYHLAPANCRFVLAISGGADSVVMLDLIAKMGFSFSIAHVNFQLRGSESERDELFVRSLGEKYGKVVFVKKIDTQSYALEKKMSIQEAAREIRYEWFSEILSEQVNLSIPTINRFTLTAHHAGDTIETILMHFFRGTGIQGLTGIQPLNTERKLLRPLLGLQKADILSYAQSAGLDFVEDSSNASDKYTRNFFRNKLLPAISEVFPQVTENLLDNSERFNEINILYQQAVQIQLKELLEKHTDEWHVPIMKWKKIIPLHTLSWELIKPFGFTAAQTPEVIKLLDAANGASLASVSHQIIHNRKWMIIAPINEILAAHILIDQTANRIQFQGGSLTFSMESDGQMPTDDYSMQGKDSFMEAFVTMDSLQYPLLLRKAKTGDYFYPLGMQKKKKISRFLIDQKLSKTEKEKVWILESNQRIIWVIGYRIDDRFKITKQTKNHLHIRYLK